MKRFSGFCLAVLWVLAFVSLPASAWIRPTATTFATLPSGTTPPATPPEGITVDIGGNVYVSTFGFPASGPTTDPGQVIVFDPHGNLLRQLVVAGASAHLLGLAFHPTTHELWCSTSERARYCASIR